MYKQKIDGKMRIDGSIGEGGGSILRVSVGIACMLNKSIIISNIRNNRKNPGLRLQHLVGIQALTELTGGSSNKLHVGLTEVDFHPGTKWQNEIDVIIKTAGSIGMLAQTLYNSLYNPPNPNRKYQIHVKGGGTYGKFAPGTDYVKNVTFAIFKQLGYHVDLNIIKHGFYPKGGGEAVITIHPAPSISHYKPFVIEERGELEIIKGAIHVEERLKKPQVAERILKSIQDNINHQLIRGVELNITTNYHKSLSAGVGVDVWFKFSNNVILGVGTTLGERGVSSEKIGKKVAYKINNLLKSSATMDEYASDQILPLLFLIEEPSKFKVQHVSSHFKTNLEILNMFFDRKWEIIKENDGFLINCL